MDLIAAATVAGMGLGLGATVIVAGLTPTRPRLSDALEALSAGVTSAGALPTQTELGNSTRTDRFGSWVASWASRFGMRTPAQDLALLEVSTSTYWAERALSALLGLAVPVLVSTVWLLITGSALPVVIPTGLGLACAMALWALAGANITSRAARARQEMAVATVAYLRLVAVRRMGAAGVTTAMEGAAQVGDSWMFTRVYQALILARIAGVKPWDSLHQLADQLQLPELHEVADITSQAGNGAAIAAHLTARATSMRDRQLNDMVAKASTRTTLMTGPLVLMAMTFTAALLVPALAAILTPG